MESNIKDEFKNGKCVVKIIKIHAHTGESHQLGIVINNDKYVKKLKSHEYTPLLYMVDLPSRLAYLFGCFDVEYSSDHIFEILYREVGSNDWKIWFTISPQPDDDFNGYTFT